MATRKKKVEPVFYPKFTQGTHLIVIEYEDGSTELYWDDEELAREVREVTSEIREAAPWVIKKGKE